MNESHFSTAEPLKMGSGMSVTIDDRSDTMIIAVDPRYWMDGLWIFFSILLGCFLAFFDDSFRSFGWTLYGLAILGIFLYQFYQNRSVYCVVDRLNQVVTYSRGGILNSTFNEEKFRFAMVDIKRIDTKRYTGRGRDTFQIFLILDEGKRLDISGGNLSFSECQTNTEMVRKFINPDLSVKAID